MLSVADAMRDAAATAADHAEKVKGTISAAGPRTLRAVSRLAYTSAYVVSYGVVYAAVFVAYSLPSENPIMHGFRDGGRAAMDALKTA
jgi:hypothetical protein